MLNMGIHDYDDCLLKTYHFESVFTSLVSFLANGFHEVFFDSSGLESVFGGSFAIPWGDSLG